MKPLQLFITAVTVLVPGIAAAQEAIQIVQPVDRLTKKVAPVTKSEPESDSHRALHHERLLTQPLRLAMLPAIARSDTGSRPIVAHRFTSARPDEAGQATTGRDIDHLMQAVSHLEAAGMREQARMLREQAAQKRIASDLAAKTRRLEQLQQELELLRDQLATGAGSTGIAIRLLVFRADLDALEPQGFENGATAMDVLPVSGHSTENLSANFKVLDNGEELLNLMKLVATDRKSLQLVTAPQIRTLNGQPAGLTISPGGDEEPFLNLTLTPHVYAGNHVCLDLGTEIGRSDEPRQMWSSSLECRFGQSILVTSRSSTGDDIVMLMTTSELQIPQPSFDAHQLPPRKTPILKPISTRAAPDPGSLRDATRTVDATHEIDSDDLDWAPLYE